MKEDLKDALCQYVLSSKRINSRSISEYDEQDITSEKNRIAGRRNKRFIRLSSRYFSELINSIRNDPNCSFHTMYNDLIRSGYTPKYFSVLCIANSYCNYDEKLEQNDPRVYIDYDCLMKGQCAMNILERTGFSTAYQKTLNLNDEVLTMSVDYISPNDRFFRMTDFDIDLESVKDYELLENNLKSKLKYMLFNKKEIISKNFYDKVDITSLADELLLAVCFRKWILSDLDCKSRNQGILVNEKLETIRIAPQYDLEFALADNYLLGGESCCFRELKWLKNNKEHLYNKLKDKVIELSSIDKTNNRVMVENIINNSVNNDPVLFDSINKKIYNNIAMFCDVVDQVDKGNDSYEYLELI